MRHIVMLLAVVSASFATLGCDQEVMEAQTPSGQEIEVERDVTTGALETEVDD